jgi:hypothetical protein
MDAKQELTWFIIIIIALGIIWVSAGGLKSLTKTSPLIKAETGPAATTSENGSWFRFLFSGFSSGNLFGQFNYSSSSNSTVSHGEVIYGGNTIVNNNKTGGKTYYGADNPPGPIVETKDTISIDTVYPSYDQQGTAGGEYVQISASDNNKNKILLTGMLLKSRMTGNQANIGEGVAVYYSNNLNKTEPVFISPGQTVYVITGRSPIGYSFRINKCTGYLNNYYQNFIVSLPNSCPLIKSYPLPARPNALKDNCLDFLDTISSCQTEFSFASDLAEDCKTFITDRANYPRCVADFSNDKDFLGDSWNIYLGRDDSLWKSKREIIDLVDQQGNVISTYTY